MRKPLSIVVLVLALWFLGFAVLKVASLLIHLLLPVAVGVLIWVIWKRHRRPPPRP